MKAGWQLKSLGELATIEIGKTPSRSAASYWDNERKTTNVWLSIADLSNAKNKIVDSSKEYISDSGAKISKIVPKGTLLVSFKLTLGRLAFAGRDLYTNEAIAALTLRNEQELSKDYLYYFLQFFDWSGAAKHDAKIKGMTFNKAKLKDMKINYPSLLEQQRIVGILEKAFATIAAAKVNAEKGKELSQVVFEAALGEIITQNKMRCEQIALGKAVKTLSTGPFGSLLHKSDYRTGGMPLVNPINIVGDKIIPDERKTVDSSTAKRLSNYLLSEGDIVIARRGEIGRCAVVTEAQDGWICGTGSFFIRPSDKVDPVFLTHLLRSKPYRQILEGASGRATMPSISNTDLANLKVAVPPINEQKRYVAELQKISVRTANLRDAYIRKQAALDELKQSILAKAFSGELGER